MNDQAFKVWRDKLVSLDRYENQEDAREFSALVSSVRDELDAKTIDVLLSTFCDEDDYGVQERVVGVLDHAEGAFLLKGLR